MKHWNQTILLNCIYFSSGVTSYGTGTRAPSTFCWPELPNYNCVCTTLQKNYPPQPKPGDATVFYEIKLNSEKDVWRVHWWLHRAAYCHQVSDQHVASQQIVHRLPTPQSQPETVNTHTLALKNQKMQEDIQDKEIWEKFKNR